MIVSNSTGLLCFVRNDAYRFLFVILLLCPSAFSAEDWKNKQLTKVQINQCREKGEETPFTGKYYKMGKEKGIFRCAICGQELFDTDHQFDAMGVTNFRAPIKPDAVELKPDPKFFMNRTEVVCSRCGSHLGHVFADGPGPTGKRYKIKSACIDLVPVK
jgi:peptide-methionine (R)-S-oxide reductase